MLSWRRTLLALSTVALLAVRLAYYSRAFVVLFAIVAVWAVAAVLGWRRMRALLVLPAAPAWIIAGTGLCIFLIALAVLPLLR